MNEFNLYFASSEYDDLKRQYNMNQLLSQYNDRSEIRDWVKYLKNHPECTSKLMIDSGAYTASTKGLSIDIEDYLKFIKEVDEYVDYFVALDVIPTLGTAREVKNSISVEDSSELSWKNYLYMIEKVDNPKKIIPVFHGGEDFKWLKNMLEFRDKNGEYIDYIGLAVGDGSKAGREQWFNQCFKIINSSSNPNVKTHAFGMTETSLLEKFPFTSSDSTSYVKQGAFGTINIKLKSSYTISIKGVKKPNHITQAPKEVQEYVDNKLKLIGTSLKELEELQERGESPRQYLVKFNLLEFYDWSINFRKENQAPTYSNNILKEELW